jgi:hypothetical protein
MEEPPACGNKRSGYRRQPNTGLLAFTLALARGLSNRRFRVALHCRVRNEPTRDSALIDLRHKSHLLRRWWICTRDAARRRLQ